MQHLADRRIIFEEKKLNIYFKMGNQSATGQRKETSSMQGELASEVRNRKEKQGHTTRTNMLEDTIIDEVSYLFSWN